MPNRNMRYLGSSVLSLMEGDGTSCGINLAISSSLHFSLYFWYIVI